MMSAEASTCSQAREPRVKLATDSRPRGHSTPATLGPGDSTFGVRDQVVGVADHFVCACSSMLGSASVPRKECFAVNNITTNSGWGTRS